MLPPVPMKPFGWLAFSFPGSLMVATYSCTDRVNSSRLPARVSEKLQQPHGTHGVRLAPAHPFRVGQRDLDAAPAQLYERPGVTAEGQTTAHGGMHETDLLGPGNHLQVHPDPVAHAAQELAAVRALPHGARGNGPVARDREILHMERNLRQGVHGGGRRSRIDPAVGKNPVPEADGKAHFRDDPVALLVLELDREKTDGIRADVDGRDAQRGELYCFSSWR